MSEDEIWFQDLNTFNLVNSVSLCTRIMNLPSFLDWGPKTNYFLLKWEEYKLWIRCSTKPWPYWWDWINWVESILGEQQQGRQRHKKQQVAAWIITSIDAQLLIGRFILRTYSSLWSVHMPNSWFLVSKWAIDSLVLLFFLLACWLTHSLARGNCSESHWCAFSNRNYILNWSVPFLFSSVFSELAQTHTNSFTERWNHWVGNANHCIIYQSMV